MKILAYIISVTMLLMSGTIGWMSNEIKTEVKTDLNYDLGSVGVGGEYKYTHYIGSVATSSLLKSGSGTFGSVIITEEQAGIVTMYDATSTAAIGTGLETKIATFEDAQAEGNYIFDTSFYDGLVFVSADGSAFAGSWTITHR